MNNLTISIVTYKNDPHQLIRTIESVLKSDLDLKLIISDNSPDNSLIALCTDKRVDYLFNDCNKGFGAGHNFVLNKIIDCSKYHLILNPDVVFDPNVLQSLVDFMDSNKDIGLVMPKVIYPNGDLQFLCKLLPTPYDWIGRRFNPIKKFVEKRNKVFELRFTDYNKTMEVPYLSGCFMFLRVDALKKVGFFDDNIFMYGEETDLCRRLIDGGYKTVFYPKVTIVHEFQKGSHKSIRLTWIGIKSAIYYFNKWGWLFDKRRTEINRDTLKKLSRL